MMNDEMENFEKRLSRQPLRKIPGEWRGEILVAADVNRREGVRAFTSAATIRSRVREIFWPAPAAWAGLAAAWIFIFAVNFSMRDNSSSRVAEKFAPPSPEVIVELKKQQRLFAELMDPRETPDADRQKIFSPKPRSERMELLMT
jgi:hypothetical protein